MPKAGPARMAAHSFSCLILQPPGLIEKLRFRSNSPVYVYLVYVRCSNQLWIFCLVGMPLYIKSHPCLRLLSCWCLGGPWSVWNAGDDGKRRGKIRIDSRRRRAHIWSLLQRELPLVFGAQGWHFTVTISSLNSFFSKINFLVINWQTNNMHIPVHLKECSPWTSMLHSVAKSVLWTCCKYDRCLFRGWVCSSGSLSFDQYEVAMRPEPCLRTNIWTGFWL